MNTLHLCLIQTSLHWEDKKANLNHFESLIDNLVEVDLIVLPEMFTTGFTMNAEAQAENEDGPTLNWMRHIAAKTGSAITGSFIVRSVGHYYNRLHFVEPDGKVSIYDKRHLFTLAGEEKTFTAGKQQLILEFRGWRIMPLICYDLRFPVWARNTNNVDLQLYVANWPERRAFPWDILLRARAIENMCYVAGLNRVGEDGNAVSHSGNSVVLNELGEEILTFTPSKSEVKTVALHKDNMVKSRKKFQFLNDQDDFEIRL